MKDTDTRLKDWLWGEYDKWYLAQGGHDKKATKMVEMFLAYLLGDTVCVESKDDCLVRGFDEYCVPSQYGNFKLVFPESECLKGIKRAMK